MKVSVLSTWERAWANSEAVVERQASVDSILKLLHILQQLR